MRPTHTTRHTLRAAIIGESKECAKNTLSLIQKCRVPFTLTSDAWSTKNGKTAFVSVLAHVLDDYWRPHIELLYMEEVNSSHTGDCFAKCWSDACSELSAEPVCIMTDNAANMVKGQSLFREAKVWERRHMMKLTCGLHSIQLSVHSALSKKTEEATSVHALKKKCQKICAQFNQSALANEHLRLAQEIHGLDYKRVTQYCATRWSTVFSMMKRLLELKTELGTLGKEGYTWLTAEELSALEDLVRVLEPVALLTTRLQEESALLADYYWGVVDLGAKFWSLVCGTNGILTDQLWGKCLKRQIRKEKGIQSVVLRNGR